MKKNTVLIVDDNMLIVEALALRLSVYLRDYDILTANSGEAAVNILKSVPVRFIMTDLQMPGMDGFGLIAYCRKNHSRVPVFAMSAECDPDTVRRLHALGVSACFEKPFDFDAVTDRIRAVLGVDRRFKEMMAGRLLLKQRPGI